MQTSHLRATWPFQALADETRFRVARLLASFGGEVRAGVLARALAIPPSHLTRHLQVLEKAGILATERVANTKLVTVLPEHRALLGAVMEMPDDSGVLALDQSRLLKLQLRVSTRNAVPTTKPSRQPCARGGKQAGDLVIEVA